MATKKQLAANRRNAQKSTGPTSPEGKAAASMNAVKSGIHAVTEVLPCEDPAEHDALVARYYNRHNPQSPEACAFLDEMIFCDWILRRLRTADTELWDYSHEKHYHRDENFPLGQPADSNGHNFAFLQRRIDANRRAYRLALECFREAQAFDKAEAAAQTQAQPETAQPSPEPPPAEMPASPTNQSDLPEIGFVPSLSFPDSPVTASPCPVPPGASRLPSESYYQE